MYYKPGLFVYSSITNRDFYHIKNIKMYMRNRNKKIPVSRFVIEEQKLTEVKSKEERKLFFQNFSTTFVLKIFLFFLIKLPKS